MDGMIAVWRDNREWVCGDGGENIKLSSRYQHRPVEAMRWPWSCRSGLYDDRKLRDLDLGEIWRLLLGQARTAGTQAWSMSTRLTGASRPANQQPRIHSGELLFLGDPLLPRTSRANPVPLWSSRSCVSQCFFSLANLLLSSSLSRAASLLPSIRPYPRATSVVSNTFFYPQCSEIAIRPTCRNVSIASTTHLQYRY